MFTCFINDIIDLNFNDIPFNLDNNVHLIGYLAPIIMLVITLLLLRNLTNYLSYFTFGYIINLVVNALLKWFIKEPRPTNDWKILQLGITHNKRVGFEKYGMPSGHAQDCGFLLAFSTLVIDSPWVTSIYSILSLICLYQRYLYQNHTLLQVIIGFVIGLGIGYLFYELGAKKLVGNIKMRPDDDGPL